MWSLRHVLALCLACFVWAVPNAVAGSCCVGSAATLPIQLGECERVLVGVSLQGRWSTGRMSRVGKFAPTGVAERDYTVALQAAVRLHRRWQIGAQLPLMLQQRVSEQMASWGGGPGDLRMGVLWDPIEERPRMPEGGGAPVPVMQLGVRAPTGRSWTQSDDVLHADVTGREVMAICGGVRAERTLDKTPWMVGLDASVGVGVVHPEASVTAYATVGRYLGHAWNLSGTLSHGLSWASVGGGAGLVQQTRLMAQVSYARPLAWRGWLRVGGDLPIPMLGRSSTTDVALAAGVLWIW